LITQGVLYYKKGGIEMNPEETSDATVFVELEDGERVEVRPTAEVEVVRNEEEPPEVPEEPKSYWEESGFLKEIANVCTYLEGEREQFLFSAEVRQIIETINNAQRVEDFDRYSDGEIQNFISTLRNRVPQVEREVMTFINQLTRARAVKVDTVDFI
jgi:hypothetical protein